MAKRVVTFGEIMLRLAPNGYYRFFQNDQLQATFGGGEAIMHSPLLRSYYRSLHMSTRESTHLCAENEKDCTPLAF